MPSMVLGNCCHAPLRPTRASRVCEPTSTPQMTSVTVTCLVDATGNRATVRSCVTPRRRLVPKLPCGYGLGGRGRQPPRTGSRGHRTPCSTIVADPTCRGPDTRRVSAITVQKILGDKGLAPRHERWLALERQNAGKAIPLTLE